ncbi:MAG: glycosyltransferase, partial [Bacteroidales bacterium]|nr:glycosyltransferase [Bacteroidales bacterium]
MLEKVCVVLASYNGQKYIREQLDSIAAQEGVEVSLLVRDDGSRDATQEILEQYQNAGALRWYTGAHLNVAQGFLELLRNAPEADYYAFCDQDDVWLPDKLAAAVAMLKQENPALPLMYYCA